MDLEPRNLKPYVWKKKLEEKGIDVDESEAEKDARKRQEFYKAELTALRERRAKLEFEYEQKRKDSEFLQRQREAEKYQHWEQQEEDFVLRQRRTRSKIRIRDGRAKPIDLFVYYISVFGDQTHETKGKLFIKEEEIDLSDSPIEFIDPCQWFNGLRIADLEALIPEMKLSLEADPKPNRQYWQDLLTIAEDELIKLRRAKQAGDKNSYDCLQPVAMDIMSLFEGKSARELEKLTREIEIKLNDNEDPTIDHHFWETALAKLKAHRARVRLGQMHSENLKNHAKHMQEEDIKKGMSMLHPNQEDEKGENEQIGPTAGSSQVGNDPNVDETSDSINDTVDDTTQCLNEYVSGRYSPQLMSLSEIDSNAVVVEHEIDYALLDHQRKKVMQATTLDEAKLATMSSDERAFLEAASKGMGNDEAQFSCEERVMGKDNRAPVYSWADKYKPRKPRYYNRVHTGFEWNKYNQTHYDVDNPPPKVVQGYKFNIFYPDLIDKHKTPIYTLTPCKDNKDFTVIRFSAGPPYEDIAFRIVNREWNNSSKNGFRCQFVNNILQLWFHFKRLRYRR